MNYYVNGALDKGGVETDKRAKEYSRQHNCDYTTALRAVVRNQQSISKRYAQEGPEPGNTIQILGGLVSGLPKLSDGSIDPAAAVSVVNGSSEYLDISRRAAGEFLSNQAAKMFGSRHAHEMNITFEDCLRVAMRDNSAVAAHYNGGKLTEAALKAVLWTKFKYSQSSDSRTTVKTYANNCEFKTYVLEAK